MAEEARSYVQGMVRKQYEQSVQNYLGKEISQAREGFERKKKAMRSEHEEEIMGVRESMEKMLEERER